MLARLQDARIPTFSIIPDFAVQWHIRKGSLGKVEGGVGEYTSQFVISKLPPAAREHNLSQFQLPSHLTVLPAPEI